MLKKLVNEAYLTLSITTTGPLLVKSGGVTDHWSGYGSGSYLSQWTTGNFYPW